MKKLIVICLLCALVFSLGAVAFLQNDNVSVASASSTSPYTLYPNPQQITFGNTNYTIPRKVAVNFGEGLDKYTVDRGYQALSKMDLVAYTNRSDLSYNFYFGIYGSNDTADAYVKTNNIAIPDGLFDKIDAYLLVVGANATVVLGKDTDATFYGLTTLSMIFEQTTGNKVRQLTVCDYSDSIYRGFIEGYYGIPWTTDERVELMEFAGQFKSNIYIYAPKDDPYHGTNWRGLYTETDLEEIREQVEAGNRSKVRFTWSIHPLLQKALTAENYEADLQVLLAKFEQLYSAGVRSFMVSADDISTGWTEDNPAPKYDATFQRTLLNDVAEWLRQKGDCRNLIFVPSAYNSISGESVHLDKEYYFQTLMGSGDDVLDESIDVMWTGAKVCSSVSNGTFDDFSNLTNGRKAFMWMNWPVNDYLPNTILMSKAEVYDVKTDANGEIPFTGIVTNPMQYAEASKVGIFATADYCWNVDTFDVDQSYADCFKYIEGNCAEQLYNICSNIANASQFEGEYFDESWALKPVIEQFWSAYHSGDEATAKTLASQLVTLFQQIVTDVDDYIANAQNQKFVANIRPFAEALKYKSMAAVDYLTTYVNVDTLDSQQIAQNLANAQTNVQNANSCSTYTLNTVTYNHDLTPVKTCVAVINPFLSDLEQYVSDDIMLALGVPTGIVYRGFDGIYQGELQNVIDGNPETFVWFDNYPALHTAYLRIDYETPQVIYDVTVLGGNADLGDTWTAILEYSLDGKNFTVIGDVSGAQTTFDLRNSPVTARYLRIRDNSTAKANNPQVGNSWCALREIQLNSLPENYVSSSQMPVLPDGTNGYSCKEEYIMDNDVNTFAYYDWKCPVGAYVQLNYQQVQTASFIRLLMGCPQSSDHFTNVVISYSMDGETFHDIDSKHFGTEIYIYLQEEISFRYLRATSQVENQSGVIIRDFSFNNTDGNAQIYYGGFDGIYAGGIGNVTDGSKNTSVHFKNAPGENAFVVWDLGEQTEISELSVYTGLVDGNGNVTGDTWPSFAEYSVDGINFVRLGEVGAETHFDQLATSPIVARYVRLVNNGATSWIAIREISVNNSLPEPTATVTFNGYTSVYQDYTTDKMIDGDENTFVWFAQTPKDDSYYVTVDYGSVQTITDIKVLTGQVLANGNYDNLWDVYVKYSVDGVEYFDAGEINLENTVIDLRTAPIEARYIRLVHKDAGGWTAVRELALNTMPIITYQGIPNGIYQGTLDNLVDGDENTYVWFNTDGEFSSTANVTIDYGKVQTINNVYLLSGKTDGGDRWDMTLEYSVDGITFVKVEGFVFNTENTLYTFETPVEARYVRLVHSDKVGWVALRECTINKTI